jgi:hypothetical protein
MQTRRGKRGARLLCAALLILRDDYTASSSRFSTRSPTARLALTCSPTWPAGTYARVSALPVSARALVAASITSTTSRRTCGQRAARVGKARQTHAPSADIHTASSRARRTCPATSRIRQDPLPRPLAGTTAKPRAARRSRRPRAASALPRCTSTRPTRRARPSWSSTRRTACTARRAPSRHRTSTLSGPCLRAAEGPTSERARTPAYRPVAFRTHLALSGWARRPMLIPIACAALNAHAQTRVAAKSCERKAARSQ